MSCSLVETTANSVEPWNCIPSVGSLPFLWESRSTISVVRKDAIYVPTVTMGGTLIGGDGGHLGGGAGHRGIRRRGWGVGGWVVGGWQEEVVGVVTLLTLLRKQKYQGNGGFFFWRVFLGSFLGLSWVFLGSFVGLSWVFRRSFLGLSWVFLGSFLEVSASLLQPNSKPPSRIPIGTSNVYCQTRFPTILDHSRGFLIIPSDYLIIHKTNTNAHRHDRLHQGLPDG